MRLFGAVFFKLFRTVDEVPPFCFAVFLGVGVSMCTAEFDQRRIENDYG